LDTVSINTTNIIAIAIAATTLARSGTLSTLASFASFASFAPTTPPKTPPLEVDSDPTDAQSHHGHRCIYIHWDTPRDMRGVGGTLLGVLKVLGVLIPRIAFFECNVTGKAWYRGHTPHIRVDAVKDPGKKNRRNRGFRRR
jgi:hypothetical protein